MQTLFSRVAGLDIHKDTVVVCVRTTSGEGEVQETIRTFGTMTDELLSLADWLTQRQVTHAAMESTGVLWKIDFLVYELHGAVGNQHRDASRMAAPRRTPAPGGKLRLYPAAKLRCNRAWLSLAGSSDCKERSETRRSPRRTRGHRPRSIASPPCTASRSATVWPWPLPASHVSG